jgi:4-hydroxy-tetrahydrodipicolinate reductase
VSERETHPRIALLGMGKMGRAIDSLARERGWTVTAALDHADLADAPPTRSRLGDPDVVIEFTAPGAAPANIVACVREGLAVVSGTTGWGEAMARVREAVLASDGALLWAPNFSVGVNLFIEMASAAAGVMRPVESFDAAIVETHHSAKKDAPSGTAKALQASVESTLGRPVPIASVRVGSVPGTHELIFDGPFEQLRLTHEARDRRVFADGALLAARWLRGRRGIFDMRDVLGLGAP